MRHFTKSTDEIWKHKEILKKSEITSLRSGYVMNTTYCQHANDKYKECKRVVTEVQLISDNGSPPEPLNYSLLQFTIPEGLSPSPRKRMRKQGKPSYSQSGYTEEFDTRTPVRGNNSEVTKGYTEEFDTRTPVRGNNSEVTKELPDFELSGLPILFESSWKNARILLTRDLVKKHPISKNLCIVASLSKNSFYNVSISDKICKCECEGYNQKNMCCHVIAVAFQNQCLENLLTNYVFPNLKASCSKTTEVYAGRKPGFKARVRCKTARHIESFRDPLPCQPSEPEALNVIFITDTKASKCYGCQGKLRGLSNTPAPPPFDIVIQTKTYRHYRENKNNNNPGVLHIKLNKENVYYHPQLVCLPDKDNRLDILGRLQIQENVQDRLSEQHKRLLFSEFGIEL